MNASDTPRTDAAETFLKGKAYVPAAFARALEREVNALTADKKAPPPPPPDKPISRLFRKKKKTEETDE